MNFSDLGNKGYLAVTLTALNLGVSMIQSVENDEDTQLCLVPLFLTDATIEFIQKGVNTNPETVPRLLTTIFVKGLQLYLEKELPDTNAVDLLLSACKIHLADEQFPIKH